jgi:hypothetical protein
MIPEALEMKRRRERYIKLHKALYELVADFIDDTNGQVDERPIGELIVCWFSGNRNFGLLF